MSSPPPERFHHEWFEEPNANFSITTRVRNSVAISDCYAEGNVVILTVVVDGRVDIIIIVYDDG